MAYFYRGKALKALGKRQEAIAAYREAVLRRPEMVELHQELARALEEEGRKKEASAEWRRLLELAPAGDTRHREAEEHLAGASAQSP